MTAQSKPVIDRGQTRKKYGREVMVPANIIARKYGLRSLGLKPNLTKPVEMPCCKAKSG